ncbi:hypothetical protein VNI00_010808 [Paramarasmius palmivorus]|uniref:Uncharacterized protein n=1 Tax=Paramarasmius palmivorus TaxID=297713 RepID=A0AAW0CFJ3_9AGAR
MQNIRALQANHGRRHTDVTLEAFVQLIPQSASKLELHIGGEWRPNIAISLSDPLKSLPNITNLVLCCTPRAVLPLLSHLPNLHKAQLSLSGHDTCAPDQWRYQLGDVELHHLHHLELTLTRYCYCDVVFNRCNALHISDLLTKLNSSSLRIISLRWRLPMAFTYSGSLWEGFQSILRTSPSLQLLILHFADSIQFNRAEFDTKLADCDLGHGFRYQLLNS